MRKLSLIILVGLVGCANPTIMKDPRTGSVFKCTTPYQYGELNDPACVKTLQSQGWEPLAIPE